MRRIAILVNPVFSPGRGRAVPQIRRIFEDAGITTRLIETTADPRTSPRIPHDGTLDAVIVCGGDGTVFGLLQQLAGTEIPIGICPFGTGNILAQNLGIPRNPIAAARALLTARPLAVPLGKITCGTAQKSFFFAMSAGIGGHAAMMRAAYRYGKHRAGRIAYFAAGFEVLATHTMQPFDLEITTVDGDVLTRRTSEMIAVRVSALNLWHPGGGLQYPFLRLASVEGTSRLRLLQASAEALLFGAGQRDRQTNAHSAAHYEDVWRVLVQTIPDRSYKGLLPVQADGEILDVLTPSAPVTVEMAGTKAIFLAAGS